jgi:hypothetical protein
MSQHGPPIRFGDIYKGDSTTNGDEQYFEYGDSTKPVATWCYTYGTYPLVIYSCDNCNETRHECEAPKEKPSPEYCTCGCPQVALVPIMGNIVSVCKTCKKEIQPEVK